MCKEFLVFLGDTKFVEFKTLVVAVFLKPEDCRVLVKTTDKQHHSRARC